MNLLNTDGVSISYFNYAKRSDNFRMADGDRPMNVLDLTLCIEGEMHYIFNGEHITLHGGDGILIPPGSFRERFETGVPTLYASVNLIFENTPEFEFEGFLPGCVNSNIIYLLDVFKKEYASASSRKNEKCLSLFSYIYTQISETVCDKENPHISAIKQYINDHISEEISLEKISRQIHLAPQYICALFKKNTGLTVTQFILKERIDLAKRYIIATSDSISSIAEACGFNDYCYFSHTFKKVTGVSANQYRKIKRQ